MDGFPARGAHGGQEQVNVLMFDQTIDVVEEVVVEDSVGVTLSGLVREIAATSDRTAREWLIDDFLRQTESLNKSIAAALCRDFKADRNTWLDEFWQLVRIASQALLEEVIAFPARADEIQHYPSLLRFRARSAVTKFVDSSAGFNQASGQSNMKRRRKELERTRAALYSRGCDPTDADIVEETNKRMLSIRSDAVRQGMICTIEDLHIAATSENIEDHAHPVSVDTVESESELHSVERQTLITACIEACAAESAQLGEIATKWFMPATNGQVDTYDGHPTAASIALEIGIEASTARAKVARVRQIAQRVAREGFGLRSGRDG